MCGRSNTRTRTHLALTRSSGLSTASGLGLWALGRGPWPSSLGPCALGHEYASYMMIIPYPPAQALPPGGEWCNASCVVRICAVWTAAVWTEALVSGHAAGGWREALVCGHVARGWREAQGYSHMGSGWREGLACGHVAGCWKEALVCGHVARGWREAWGYSHV